MGEPNNTLFSNCSVSMVMRGTKNWISQIKTKYIIKLQRKFLLNNTRGNKLVSTIKFWRKIAESFSKVEYYITYGDEVVNLPQREQE